MPEWNNTECPVCKCRNSPTIDPTPGGIPANAFGMCIWQCQEVACLAIMKTRTHFSVCTDVYVNIPCGMPVIRCANVGKNHITVSALAPRDLFTHKHAQTTRQTRWRSRVPTLVTNTRTYTRNRSKPRPRKPRSGSVGARWLQ